ncbi:MAG TPA: glycoside hydrolase family 15 protein [Candidatus Binataceae bacterium]|nr:glycoside hydrolase family 15 protein [Candidatus Binataceae bacterium]
MATLEYLPIANGGPGIPPRWTHSAKDVVGTAYSASSRVWFTVSNGVISEVYFSTLDRPQIRDLQYLVTDGETFFHDTHRNLDSTIEYLGEHGLGVRIINAAPAGRYRIVIDVIADPHQPCVLLDTSLEGDPAFLRKLRMYVILAPHLEVGGWGNNGNVARIAGREFLTAHKGATWLALAATTPFVHRSCGYVGTTDGWQDLSRNFKLDREFASAPDGNIALTGEIDLRSGARFTLALGFGRTLHHAITTVSQTLGTPFEQHRERFLEQWSRATKRLRPLEKLSGDGGMLYRRSRELILTHEDKNYPGALIASLSIPWGEAKGDEDLGGYHLVWTRDMVNSATGLMAAGDLETPLRALIYLACSQLADGSFPQNFWVDGEPYWTGIQLDEVAFPIMLAWRLHKAGALADFDPYPMVKAAATFLIDRGCVTPQERWEENSGYSPSTLASNIAALVCAAAFAQEQGDTVLAGFFSDFADFIESHVEAWTVTRRGVIVPGIKRHYIRINPEDPANPLPDEDPDHGTISIRNRAPGEQTDFPAAEIVDAGFLELVRYGIRRAGDPMMEDSLRVIDAALKTDFPGGPCWRRYNHDGYGQLDDGGPFINWGRGRPWPLLTGERAHYELAAGRDARPYIRAIESFATATRLLPEQIWDQPDLASAHMFFGKPTGAAMPLMWAHAEYIKLLRSADDGQVFDLIPEVAERYLQPRRRPPLEVWKFNRQVRAMVAGTRLRIQAGAPFTLHWGRGDWSHAIDSPSYNTSIGMSFVDLTTAVGDTDPLRFTFRWSEDNRWEGRDFTVEVRAS